MGNCRGLWKFVKPKTFIFELDCESYFLVKETTKNVMAIEIHGTCRYIL